MLVKKVKNRIILLIFAFILSILIVFSIVKSLNKNLLYFKTPTDLKEKIDKKIGKQIRLGGMVKKGSIQTNRDEIRFIITDLKNEIYVSFKGTVPNLFLEGKGVVAEGVLKDNKYFVAERILAKHDENYMPPNLKKVINNEPK